MSRAESAAAQRRFAIEDDAIADGLKVGGFGALASKYRETATEHDAAARRLDLGNWLQGWRRGRNDARDGKRYAGQGIVGYRAGWTDWHQDNPDLTRERLT